MEYENDVKVEVIDYLVAKFIVESGVKVNNIEGYEIIVGNMKVSVSDMKHELNNNSKDMESEVHDENIKYIINKFDKAEDEFNETKENVSHKVERLKELLNLTIRMISDIVEELEFEIHEYNKEIKMLNDLKLEVFEFTQNTPEDPSLLSEEFSSFNSQVGEKINDEKKLLFKKMFSKEYNHDIARVKLSELKARDFVIELP